MSAPRPIPSLPPVPKEVQSYGDDFRRAFRIAAIEILLSADRGSSGRRDAHVHAFTAGTRIERLRWIALKRTAPFCGWPPNFAQLVYQYAGDLAEASR